MNGIVGVVILMYLSNTGIGTHFTGPPKIQTFDLDLPSNYVEVGPTLDMWKLDLLIKPVYP